MDLENSRFCATTSSMQFARKSLFVKENVFNDESQARYCYIKVIFHHSYNMEILTKNMEKVKGGRDSVTKSFKCVT